MQHGVCVSDSTCSVTGDSCNIDSNCCTARAGSCAKVANISRCTPLSCRQVGDICTDQCCSRQCNGNQCAPPSSQEYCLTQGSDCSTGSDCCSNVCSQGVNGRLSCFALDGCQPLGESCNDKSECCSRSCTDNGAGYRCSTTSIICASEGELCLNQTKCCPGAASNCGSAWFGLTRCSNSNIGPNYCIAKGLDCAYGAQCCTGHCALDATFSFTCQNDCKENGLSCSDKSECCRGYCSP